MTISTMNYCKYFFAFTIIFSIGLIHASAQSKPQLSQYILNPYILNPAFAGIENYNDLKFSYRKQWVGLDGAPTTIYATFHAPIAKKDLKNSATTLYGNDEASKHKKQYWSDYKASKAHSGIGIQIFNDAIGPFNNFSVMGSYSYHLGISPKINMAFGLSAGVKITSLNIDKLFFGNSTTQDPAIFYTNKIDKYNMDADAGLLFYSARFYIGLSALSLIPQNLSFADNFVVSDKVSRPNHYLSAGYRFPLNDELNLLPSLRFRYLSPEPIQTDFNAKLQYRDLIWVGLGYRSNYGVIGMVGINVMSKFTISYSYDYTTTQINTISNGSHEVVIGFAFKNGRKSFECNNRAW